MANFFDTLLHERRFWAAACGCLFALGLFGACKPAPEPCDAGDPDCAAEGCEYGGERFEPGASFPSSDGCNTCTCTDGGAVACTERACLDAGAADGCEYAGNSYAPGESFPSDDGCNTCTCTEGGAVACTKRACAPKTECDGSGAQACPDGEYCALTGPYCGGADPTGVCTAKPEVCTEEYAPVCGCDGRTYGNACAAGMAGVSVATQGECTGTTCTFGETEFRTGQSVVCPDGCNQCACDEEGRWISTLVACEPTYIERCDDSSESTTGLSIAPIYLAGDALALSVQYGGGCFPHTFKLCYGAGFQESLPVQTRLWLIDTTEQMDPCLALPTQEVVFDLTPLRETFTEMYPNGPNTLVLNVDGSRVEYEF